MLSIANYKKAESLEEAWELNQKRSNRIIGGMLWLKMENIRINTAIDLSGLGLDRIEETEDSFSVGCMTPLRELATNEAFNRYTCGAAREAVRHIVGVQFRNLATVGGSIFGRYGFSDVLTLFSVLDAQAELYRGGLVPIREFAVMKPDNDILVRIIVKKTDAVFTYRSVRNTATDFPVLTCAGSYSGERLMLAVGARPGRAACFDYETDLSGADEAERIACSVREKIVTGSNMRAGAEYRKHLAGVLSRRVCGDLAKEAGMKWI